MKIVICLLAILAVILCKDAPLYDYAYRISFDEAVVENKTQYKVNGQMFYDPKNNRERVDRSNGRWDLFCGTVLPNQNTPCQQITVNNKRFIIYPNKQQCCFCCDSEHGCGILRPDWLADAEYKGTETLSDGFTFDKWSKPGING